ncbi:ATP-dependent helicase [archaeon CG10_big_fil_rev_8_21_14_0_10_43_11]|nr:MAG: ATP-dependent helicase [archaeon CG10_big_fil_rev_8_21_14_0_10_43_11]
MTAINEHGFEKPTEIQEKTIPLIVSGRDIIGASATGSGKTLAFASAIIQNTTRSGSVQALVLTPTRELAEQVCNAIKAFSKHTKLSVIAVYGGVGIEPQIRKLQSADVVVGTPGRILDHVSRRTINLQNTRFLVLDEADKMFDMGFKDDVERIISKTPKERQTMLFSATITEDVVHLSQKHMNNPVRVIASTLVDPKKLHQIYYDVEDGLKLSVLVYLLKREKSGLVMVFCNSRRMVDRVAKSLKKQDIDAKAIHGGFSQNRRSNVMEEFNTGEELVLVCTDVAARGLDISGVSHVYNFDIPDEANQYVHRIGRTARAGEAGIAINLLSARDHEKFSHVLHENDLHIERVQTPYVQRVALEHGDEERRRNFGPRKHHRNQSRSRVAHGRNHRQRH